MTIVEKYSMTADNLLAGPEIPVLTKNFKVTAGTAMKTRHFADGKYGRDGFRNEEG